MGNRSGHLGMATVHRQGHPGEGRTRWRTRRSGSSTRAGGSASSPRGLTRSTRTRSCRWWPATSAARAWCSTSGAGRDRSPGASRAPGRRWWASIPPPVSCRWPASGRADPTTSVHAPKRCPVRAGAFDTVVLCLALEHVDAFETAIHEVARVLEPGGRFVLVLCHPLLQAPGRRLDRRPDRRRAVLADRRLPPRGASVRRGGSRGRPAVHPPPAESLRPRDGRGGPPHR